MMKKETNDIGNNSNNLEDKINSKASLILFSIIALCTLFIELGATSLWGSEDRWADVTKNILLSGDWFHPAINGKIYFDKPLISYWLIAIPAIITGVLNEFIIRLPSVLAAITALISTFLLADKLWNRKTAIISSWLLLAAYGFIFWARKGAADLENLAAIIVAITIYFYWKDKTSFYSYLLFGLVCAIGAHTKGLPAVVIPIAVIAPDLMREQKWKKHLNWKACLTLFICISVYLLPFILSALTDMPEGWKIPKSFDSLKMPEWAQPYRKQLCGLYLVWKENVLRAFEPFDHQQPFYAYFLHLPRILLPWTPLFILAIASFCKNWKNLDYKNRWVLESVIIIFILFSLSGSKRWYYILPIIPFCAILTASFLSLNHWEKIKKYLELIYQYLFFIFASGLMILLPLQYAVSLFFKKSHNFNGKIFQKIRIFETLHFSPASLIILSVIGMLLLTLWILYIKKPENFDWIIGKQRRSWGLILVSMGLFTFCFFSIMPSMIEQYRTTKPFAFKLKSYMTNNNYSLNNIAFYKKSPDALMFYLKTNKPITIIRHKPELDKFLHSPGKKKLIISQYRYIQQLQKDCTYPLSKPLLLEKQFPWEKQKKKLVVLKISQPLDK